MLNKKSLWSLSWISLTRHRSDVPIPTFMVCFTSKETVEALLYILKGSILEMMCILNIQLWILLEIYLISFESGYLLQLV